LNPTPLPVPADAWTRRFWRLVWLVVAFRVVFLLFFIGSTDLAGDEAYYWDWGRQPDWGYYSKPPMIGWLMALVSALSGGGTEWAIRGTSLLLGTASLLLLHALTRRLFDARAAAVAVLLVLLTPANAALNLFLTIDAPLVLLWTGALLLFWRAAEKPEAWNRWLALGAVIGLGVLSKQMMLLFPLLMLIWAAFSQADRRLFGRAGFWTAMLLGVAALTPVLWWNQQHQWITLEHTKHHFNADARSLADHGREFFQFPALQALLYTPVTWLLLMAALCKVWRGWRTLDRPALFLGVFSVLPLTPFFFLALRQEVNPNWPAVFYIGLFILLAAWMTGALFGGLANRWRKQAFIIGGVFTALTYLLPAVIDAAGWQGEKRADVFADLRGWAEAGKQAGALLDQCPRPQQTLVVVLGHRYNAAHMAFHMPQRPRVYRWERDGAIMSQYEVWPAPTDKVGWDALVIYPDPDQNRPRVPLSTFFARHFEQTRVLGEIRVPIGHGRGYSAQAVLCSNMLRWPPPIPAKQPVEPPPPQSPSANP
jgi:hypothetical protein